MMRFRETLRSYATACVVVFLACGGIAQAQCIGDCSSDGQVTVDEIISGISIALGTTDIDTCLAADSNADGLVTVDEIVAAVSNALSGCPNVVCGDCNDDDLCTTDFCDNGQCVNDPVVCSDDGEECTAEFCDPVAGCVSRPVDDGTSCDGGAGSCQSGACVSAVAIEYQQDFESLDAMEESALADDGWLVFGNVFDGESGAFLYGYGPFPAPNGDGSAFCAIALGQGGAEQGSQQMVVVSDYNNADHANGHRIEASVFRERPIVAGDVGKTLTFEFDAKRGNLNDPNDPTCPCTSTALAFFKTLDPNAGFALTNFVTVDMTSIPDAWATYSITLTIDAGLVGQILQYGFSNDATLYQPSGVFYDNISVSSIGGTTMDGDGDGYCVPNGIDGNADGDCDDAGENTADVDCDDTDATSFPQEIELICADGADNDCDGDVDAADSDCPAVGGELTINGDFEAGDISGWTDFSAVNNGTFAATMEQANGGAWSGNLTASVPGAGGPASFPLVKQANIGLGTVTPNSSVTIAFDLFGSQAGIGGVVFAEFFSELTGGGTSKSEILSGAPLFPNPPNDWTADWVSYSFTTTTGPDVSGGVTLQLKADCGANPGCMVDVFFDNVSVTVP